MKKNTLVVNIFLSLLTILLLFSCSPQQSVPTNAPSSAPSPTPQSPIPPPTPTPPTPTPPPSTIPATTNLTVYFIDVGQGDAILIDYGEIEILIDGGEKSPGVVDYIRPYIDGALDVMVATHTHADHIGGLIDVLAKYQVKDIWLNGDTATSATYSQFMNSVNAEGATIHQAQLGNTIQAGTLIFNVLNPTKPLFPDINNNSIVLSLSYGNVDFLFTGDAESEAEGKMLVQSIVPLLDYEILKVGHHASRTASSTAFLNVIKPDVAIYSAGMGNTYGHPHQETLLALNTVGAGVYGTDVHGAVTVTTDGKTYDIKTEKQAPLVKTSPISPNITPHMTPNATSTTQNTAPNSTTPTNPPTVNATPMPPTFTPVQVNVVIARIFYDGLVPRTEADEYVEIMNQGSQAVDLKGWILKDISDGTPSFTFPSYILQSGKSIRVYTNEIHPEWGGFSFGRGTAIWNNTSHDIAGLYNPQGQEVSRKSY